MSASHGTGLGLCQKTINQKTTPTKYHQFFVKILHFLARAWRSYGSQKQEPLFLPDPFLVGMAMAYPISFWIRWYFGTVVFLYGWVSRFPFPLCASATLLILIYNKHITTFLYIMAPPSGPRNAGAELWGWEE